AAKYRNAGQVCISPTRFLVQKEVKNKFARALVQYAQSLTVGDGLDPGTQMGPLANARRVAAMEEFTGDALLHGGELLCGGERHGSIGNYWRPTVLADMTCDAKLLNDEPFGPIAA